MCHHPNQFLLKRDLEFLRILTHSLNADENIAIQHIPFAIVKRNNVRMGIVLQILLVDA